jgi:hypothetical protein
MPRPPAKKSAKKRSSVKGKRRATAARASSLHRAALQHNWDDGVARLEQILGDPVCDLGTALAIYWMGGPGFDQRFATVKDLGRDRWRRETLLFLRRLERRILKRDFATATILFNPRFDRTTISRDGHDWTAEYADTKVVRPIPDTLKEPSCVDPAWEARGRKAIVSSARRLT